MERVAQPAPVAAGTAPVGIIGILTSDGNRYTRFWLSMLATQRLPNILLEVKIGLNIAEARNAILRQAKALGVEWVWFLDDDHAWGPDLLQKLLAHEVDVVQPLVLVRQYPFGPVHMGPPAEDGKWWRYALMPGQAGLMECEAVGCAGMLIRRRVWEQVPAPWFEVGQINSQELGEDLHFCLKVRKAGFRVWCDLDHPLGHLLHAGITPRRRPDGSWYTELSLGEVLMEIPPAPPKHMINADGSVQAHLGSWEGEEA